MPGRDHRAALHLRTARRLWRSGAASPRALLSTPDPRLVFVIGSPRSGTTFLASCLGAVPGLVDLGEVAALKAIVPSLASAPVDEASTAIRRTLGLTLRIGLVGARRGIEQTPETTFVVPAVRVAYPQATFVHIVRDGRDVVCSLLERGWLRASRGGVDDAGHRYGAQARFWVEAGREEEFGAASEARRCAWAWRRYVETALELAPEAVHVRYEQVVTDPEGTAATLAAGLELGEVRPLAAALERGFDRSIGRHAHDLDPAQRADVEAEAGELLTTFGYR